MVRTLLIGIDGFTFHILDDLVKDVPGRGIVMPNIKNILDTGFRAELRSTPHPLTPPAWTTLFTGKGPGDHGVFDFMRSEDKGQEVFFTLSDFRDIRAETVWSIATRQHRSVVSLNFPMMAPPPEINGSLIPGFTSARHLRRNSYPKGLFERLSGIPGFSAKGLAWDFERENEIGLEMDFNHLSKWIGYHLPREKLWYEVAGMLMKEDQPDLMAVMFDGADKIQHQAWRFIDPDLRDDEEGTEAAGLREICLSYYRSLDRYVGGLVANAGSDTQVFLASDHGFTATTNVVRINRYLKELGHLTFRDVSSTDAAQRRADSPFAYLDWNQTKAFCPTPSSNAIRIRVARQAGDPGVPPDQYEEFRERLIEDLYKLTDPETGKGVVAEVLKREDVFAGAAMSEAPDLTLVLSDYGFVSVRNLEPVVVQRSFPAGTHHPHGIFLAAGPGVKQGAADKPLEIADVAATMLHSLGLPVPEDLSGVVATRCFENDYLEKNPVRIGPPTLPVSDIEPPSVSVAVDSHEADKRKILDQLAMLGYLEE